MSNQVSTPEQGGRLTLADLSALTGIAQHRLEFFFSGGVALTASEEALLMPVLHREHERHARATKGKK